MNYRLPEPPSTRVITRIPATAGDLRSATATVRDVRQRLVSIKMGKRPTILSPHAARA
jgi:hypothetical protein